MWGVKILGKVEGRHVRKNTWSAEPSIEDQIDRPTLALPTTAPMDAKQILRRFSDIQFRVLVIGRANAGKTSILQRVCETTESPTIYRGDEEVRDPNFCVRARMISQPTRLHLTRQWKLVAAIFLFGCL
jgi:hypothetical protein